MEYNELIIITVDYLQSGDSWAVQLPVARIQSRYHQGTRHGVFLELRHSYPTPSLLFFILPYTLSASHTCTAYVRWPQVSCKSMTSFLAKERFLWNRRFLKVFTC
jgi:hypothetical protein